MSEKVEEKAVGLINQVGDIIGRLSEKLEQIAAEHGNEVVDTILDVARITAATRIATAIALLVGCGLALRFWWPAVRAVWNCNWNQDGDGLWSTFGAFLILGATMFGVIGLVMIVDIWSWIGIFEPKLWIAKRVLGW